MKTQSAEEKRGKGEKGISPLCSFSPQLLCGH